MSIERYLFENKISVHMDGVIFEDSIIVVLIFIDQRNAMLLVFFNLAISCIYRCCFSILFVFFVLLCKMRSFKDSMLLKPSIERGIIGRFSNE
ncbi:MAG: hypothetical protein AUI84_20335 [Delftia sp. 13_1_40CM_3_66_6]|nr:MAG: hypothetical protein AUG53_11170 [Delftia sp. 13_1_20CM_4_67_18]OLE92408.1 MAG: hypothetical protein AUI84_20335 [Delftia sp. 13_1_40CM_3_66_6]